MSSNIPSASSWPAWRPAPDPAESAGAERRRRAALRREGAVRGAVGLGVALLLALWKPVLAWVVGGIALALLLLALAAPGVYARISGWLERFARGVGTAVTWLLMPVLFYLLFLPVGLVLRLRGRLRLTRGADRSLPTYWEEPPAGHGWGDGGAEQYRRQF